MFFSKVEVSADFSPEPPVWCPPALLVHPSKPFPIHGHYLPWQRLWNNGIPYDALNSLGEGQQSVYLERYKCNKWRSGEPDLVALFSLLLCGNRG